MSGIGSFIAKKVAKKAVKKVVPKGKIKPSLNKTFKSKTQIKNKTVDKKTAFLKAKIKQMEIKEINGIIKSKQNSLKRAVDPELKKGLREDIKILKAKVGRR